MQTVVVVGNSRTFSYGPFLVTPRGYLDKYEVEES
jgi:precorrin-3B C17-methyltransferase